MRKLILSLLLATAASGVQIAYDNTQTQDPGLGVSPFGPNSSAPDPLNATQTVVIDLLGDQIQLDTSPTGWLNGYEAMASLYNLGVSPDDDFTGVLRLSLYNVSGGVLGSLIGSFLSPSTTVAAGGLTGTTVTWDLLGTPLSIDMVWLVEVVSYTPGAPGGLPLIGLENYIDPKTVGVSSDLSYWHQLNGYSIVQTSSGLGNDSFFFRVTTVPEPGTGLLLVAGAIALGRRRLVASLHGIKSGTGPG